MKHKPRLPIEEVSFGKRLARIRKARELTQEELGKQIGLSKRMVAYYETQSKHIPSAVFPAIAKALHISTDELLGLKKLSLKEPITHLRLQRKLSIICKLPYKQRKALLDQAEALYQKQQGSTKNPLPS